MRFVFVEETFETCRRDTDHPDLLSNRLLPDSNFYFVAFKIVVSFVASFLETIELEHF